MDKPQIASVGMTQLREKRGQTGRKRAQSFLVRLPHPKETEILEKIEQLEQGEVEDATSVLAEIREMLTSEGTHVSFTTTKLGQDNQVSDELFLGPDQKPVVGHGVFMIYLQRPDKGADLQGQVYKSFGPASGFNRRGWNEPFLAAVNEAYRKAIGVDVPQGESDRIADGETAGNRPGQREVLPS